MEAYLVVEVLIIQGHRYTINDLLDNYKLLPALYPAKLATHEVGKNDSVFGGQCPLSNLYISDFDVGGVMYKSNETFHVNQKAEFAKDAAVISAVMKQRPFKNVNDSVRT